MLTLGEISCRRRSGKDAFANMVNDAKISSDQEYRVMDRSGSYHSPGNPEEQWFVREVG